MISKYKKAFEPLLAIIAFPFLSWNPSVLTLLSLAASIIFFLGIITHIYWLSIISILGFLFDVLDGYVARKKGKTSAFGGFLDSVCDRIADFFFITSFGFAHLVPWEIVAPVLFTGFLISYMRSRGDLAFNLGHAPTPGIAQRPLRVIILLIGFFLFVLSHSSLVLTYTFGIIFILNCITIIQRFFVFSKLSYV